MTHIGSQPLWQPTDASRSRMAAFGRQVRATAATPAAADLDPTDFGALWRWSVTEIEEFWTQIWDHFDVGPRPSDVHVLAERRMPGHGWFDGAHLNYAAQALRLGRDEDPAIIACGEGRQDRVVTWAELRSQVADVAQWLRAQGVGPGDRVAAYLPNCPEAVVAFLACAAVGGVWALCGPDLGVPGALARLRQLEPVVLVAADGYRWNGVVHDRRDHVGHLVEGLPGVRAVLAVDHVGQVALGPGTASPAWTAATPWSAVLSGLSSLHIDDVPAEHPLWILFSSGTSGPPKGIVHSHVGIVLEHLKQLGLHYDLREGERLFWFTSTNWMMWNLQVSTLLLGASAVIYDGSPSAGGSGSLWDIAARTRSSVFGTSPGYLVACGNDGVRPSADRDLSALRILGVTGAPVSAATFAWCARELGPTVQVSSAAGGTDVASAFATSNPLTAVWAGESSGPALGVALAAWDEHGEPRVGEVGELVVTSPMPSMPLRFWGDPTGVRYREAYFTHYPGVWRHGDWVIVTDRGGVVFTGRSDSTLNRNGVRFGSADVYAAMEHIDGVVDQLVVGVELPEGGYWMPLFVQLKEGASLDTGMRAAINGAIAAHASVRHVPDDIIVVPGVPRTRTGKRLEIPVKRLLQGASPARVVDSSAVDRPELLEFYAALTPPSAVG